MPIGIVVQDIEDAKAELAQVAENVDRLFNHTNSAEAQLIAMTVREAGIRIALVTMQATRTS